MIYKYVITEPNGIQYVEYPKSRKGYLFVVDSIIDGWAPKKFANARSANPLRAVCRRMKWDTEQLEIELNRIHFKTVYKIDPVELFGRFLFNYPERLHHRLRRIVLIPVLSNIPHRRYVEPARAHVYTMVGFCSGNPSVVVEWHLVNFSQSGNSFIFQAVCMALRVRHDLNYLRKAVNGSRLLEERWLLGNGLKPNHIDFSIFDRAESYPKNLRMFPTEASFNERLFRETLAKSWKDTTFILDYGDRTECWVSLAREIFENGI